MQGFHNKEISESRILDILCIMRSPKSIDEGDIEKWLHSDAYEQSFEHITDMDIADAVSK